jgi:hypothetical protein
VAVIPVHSSAANIPLVKQGKRASWNLPTLLDGIVVDSSESEDEGEDSLVKHKSMHDIMHDVEHGLYKNKRLGISRRKRAFQAPTIDNGGSALSSARSLSSHGLVSAECWKGGWAMKRGCGGLMAPQPGFGPETFV